MTTVSFTTRDGVPSLELTGAGERPSAVTLEGARARIDAVLTGGGKTWRARLVLHTRRWGNPSLPVPSGRYRLVVDGAEAPRDSLETQGFEMLRASFDGGSGVVEVGPPQDPDELAPQGPAAVAARRAAEGEPLEDAVFFESFYGRNASCNPLALDREIARVAPHVPRYWSVVDLSVAVPEGATALVEGSASWWRARATSRLLVVNDWLRHGFRARPGQHVLQTWHGTPLKRLALHRPGFDPRRMAAVVRESRRWSILLAQNPYAARILRKAYAFLRRPIWVEGYPRNDVLTTHGPGGSGARGPAAAVRRGLGIGDGERVLLYAPTWRDDRELIVDFLDPQRLAEDADAVVLVRGHSRTLLPGSDVAGPRVIDVTGYPDVSRLVLASDALITDYSSVMFDYSVTGKPIYFFAPDLDHYRGRLRGFYFDLAERAPGPVVSTHGELVDALTDPAVTEVFAARYDAWRAVFNSRDDGRAAERVVARLRDQGLLRG
ncbi:CDP-glycerol glycerophosphotransferase family protein [Microbacterium sp. NPDC078428]|uniref:CDP-glycerol glycerophosphotransferase family protein n=1 Tax=Microbacterium sp. NPDC078428 TaxID=3364190 RepID=UPI0037CA0DF2